MNIRRGLLAFAAILVPLALACSGSGDGHPIPEWARPADARLMSSDPCDSPDNCEMHYVTNSEPLDARSALIEALEAHDWDVRATDAGVGAAQFLKASPSGAEHCLYYRFAGNHQYGVPLPSETPLPNLEWQYEDLRVRREYQYELGITVDPCVIISD